MSYVITRNNVSLETTDAAVGKKSKTNPGMKFQTVTLPRPVLATVNYNGNEVEALVNPEGIKWTGVEDAMSMLDVVIRATALNIWRDCIDEDTGVFDEQQFVSDFADFSAGAVKKSQVEEEISDLQALIESFVEDDNFGAKDSDGRLTKEADALNAKMVETTSRLHPLKKQLAEITAKYVERAKNRRPRTKKAEAIAS